MRPTALDAPGLVADIRSNIQIKFILFRSAISVPGKTRVVNGYLNPPPMPSFSKSTYILLISRRTWFMMREPATAERARVD
jgi:hypothetical protein